MNSSTKRLFVIAVVAGIASAVPNHSAAAQPRAAGASPCAADSNYQHLAFWVGDWDVYDSTGVHYATQRVHSAVDACALTTDWAGRAGDKGLGVSAFDRRSGEWRQVYVSNQVPAPSGVSVRKSDQTYAGPGVRFVPLLDPPAGDLARSRVTILPMSDQRTLQLFEDSSDGGKTWHTVFKAEHRLQRGNEP